MRGSARDRAPRAARAAIVFGAPRPSKGEDGEFSIEDPDRRRGSLSSSISPGGFRARPSTDHHGARGRMGTARPWDPEGNGNDGWNDDGNVEQVVVRAAVPRLRGRYAIALTMCYCAI